MKVPEPRKMSSGNYYIQLRLDGVSIPVTASTASECKRQAALIKAEHKAGKRLKRCMDTKTLADGIDELIASKSNILSKSSIRGYTSIRNSRFQSIMHKPMTARKDWQRIINDEAAYCSPKTVKNAWSVVCTVLKANNIEVPKVVLPPVVYKEHEWLTPEQILVCIDAVKDLDWAAAPLLGLHSLRRSEIYAVLANGGIDLEEGVIHVRGAMVMDKDNKLVYQESNKTASSRRDVPIMIPELAAVIARGDTTIDIHPNTLHNRINSVCKKAGLPEVGTHGLRHSFASLAYYLGWPEMHTMKIGGWDDAQTMRKIYTHLAEKDLKEKTKSMAQFFQNAH